MNEKLSKAELDIAKNSYRPPVDLEKNKRRSMAIRERKSLNLSRTLDVSTEVLDEQDTEAIKYAAENIFTRNLLQFTGIRSDARTIIPRMRYSQKLLNVVKEMNTIQHTRQLCRCVRS
ncbi:hypothetical protein HHI36_016028 [Cryptolaemus montrouzieri]|uniref:Uncharacterized protein n=1 Tax=Cryptolaemus montrouzieri TaxID=559131 RepID=A0ABD2N7D0_9CUCU